MARKVRSFRVGKVWYLCYYENGQRRRPSVGSDKQIARRLAAQTNAQLENGAPAPLSFEPLSNAELRNRWLHYHEHVLRSSVATVQRYRTATAHFLSFVEEVEETGATRQAASFRPAHAEAFAAHLRRIRVVPNGHRNAAKRPLRDKGVKYILEACRSMFNYAAKRRHLPPYTENPFAAIEIERIPIEDSKPFVDLSPEQERALLSRCDDWQFPILLTLLLTGLRPGELRHLLLPDDVDLDGGWLRVRNKPALGWQVKTRNERTVPLLPELADVLRVVVDERHKSPVFWRRRFARLERPTLIGMDYDALRVELEARIARHASSSEQSLSREEAQRVARKLWSDMGAVKTDRIRTEFMGLTTSIGLPHLTAPKMLRHLFATALQDANVDPLIRSNRPPAERVALGSPLEGGVGFRKAPLGPLLTFT